MNLRHAIGMAALVGAAATQTALATISDVYAVNLRASPNTLLRFPVNAPANNVISANASYDGFAIDFNGDASVLYGITAAASPGQQFGTIDTTTGNFTPIGLTGVAEANWGGLAHDATNGNMYALAGTNLYTMNLATGAATLATPLTAPGMLLIDIAVHPITGQMYGHDIATDNLVSIDKVTGLVTPIGPTGFLANFAQGMDFDPQTGILYATVYTGGGTGAFCSFDLNTGAATAIVSTTPWNAEMEMAIAPAPGALALVGLGGLAMLRRRR
ncbi:hypothetical protein PHYC_01798 [Phycisphaerales bacterium]|nr:hypothetical protein PHYC_01798 [Phycisphaerales bacterium]